MDTKIPIHFKASGCLMLAAAALLLPMRWLLAFMLSVTVHETGHLIAISLVGAEIREISFRGIGAEINTGVLLPWQELLCSIAGPLAGSFLIFAVRIFPEAAVCGLMQTVFNLLPVYPLDGGRSLRALFFCFWEDSLAQRLFSITEFVLNIGLILYCVRNIVSEKQNILSSMLLCFLVFRLIIRKIPCKER